MKLRPGPPEEAGMSSQRVRHVAELANTWVDQGITPALVVLAARRGIIVLHEAFGRLTPEPDSPPLQRDTIYPIASITKPITATAAMVLVEDGLLGLYRPVSEYIPEFTGEGKNAVMVYHLLTHTSGLQDVEADTHAEKKKGSADATFWWNEARRSISAHAEEEKGSVEIPPADESQHPRINEYLYLRYEAPLSKTPGAEMSYCNYGYVLLGEIIRRVSRRSLDDFARERIFEPLGMKDTSYRVPEVVRHRIVRRPPDSPEAIMDMPALQEQPWPMGGAFSSGMDMALFGQMFLNRGSFEDARVLSPASVAAMTSNQVPGIGARYGEEIFSEACWGFGWDIQGDKKVLGTLRSPATFSHVGFGGVFLWVDPVYEIVGVYLSVAQGQWNADLFMNAVTAAIIDA